MIKAITAAVLSSVCFMAYAGDQTDHVNIESKTSIKERICSELNGYVDPALGDASPSFTDNSSTKSVAAARASAHGVTTGLGDPS